MSKPLKRKYTSIKNRTRSGKHLLGRTPEGREALVEKDYKRELESWTEFTPDEATAELMRLGAAANKDFAAGLGDFVRFKLTSMPGMTFKELQKCITYEYAALYQA